MPNVTELRINGARVRVNVQPERPLLGVLRDELDLTGAKYGCGEGRCGACTVLIDGAPARSCTTPVGKVADAEITTIEGLAHGDALHPLQEAFLSVGAMQCGYCTSGMIMAGVALLRETPNPTRDQIVDAMNGNVCRCGTYPRILRAFAEAATALKEARR